MAQLPRLFNRGITILSVTYGLFKGAWIAANQRLSQIASAEGRTGMQEFNNDPQSLLRSPLFNLETGSDSAPNLTYVPPYLLPDVTLEELIGDGGNTTQHHILLYRFVQKTMIHIKHRPHLSQWSSHGDWTDLEVSLSQVLTSSCDGTTSIEGVAAAFQHLSRSDSQGLHEIFIDQFLSLVQTRSGSFNEKELPTALMGAFFTALRLASQHHQSERKTSSQSSEFESVIQRRVRLISHFQPGTKQNYGTLRQMTMSLVLCIVALFQRPLFTPDNTTNRYDLLNSSNASILIQEVHLLEKSISASSGQFVRFSPRSSSKCYCAGCYHINISVPIIQSHLTRGVEEEEQRNSFNQTYLQQRAIPIVFYLTNRQEFSYDDVPVSPLDIIGTNLLAAYLAFGMTQCVVGASVNAKLRQFQEGHNEEAATRLAQLTHPYMNFIRHSDLLDNMCSMRVKSTSNSSLRGELLMPATPTQEIINEVYEVFEKAGDTIIQIGGSALNKTSEGLQYLYSKLPGLGDIGTIALLILLLYGATSGGGGLFKVQYSPITVVNQKS